MTRTKAADHGQESWERAAGEGGPTLPALLRDRRMILALVACALSVAVYLFVRHLSYPSMVDLVVYRAEGLAVRNHIDLYGHLDTPHGLPATYPPFAAMLFVPLTMLPLKVLLGLGVAVNLLLVAVVVALSLRLVKGRWSSVDPIVVPLAAALAIWFEPVFTTMRYGQVNLVIMGLVLADFTLRPGSRLHGVGIGLAAALKVTPLIFIVYLLLTGRRRAGFTALATFAATIAVAVAYLPSASRSFWTKLVFDPSRVGRVENAANQSLRGLATRVARTLDIGTLGTAAVLAVALFGMLCAVVAYRRRGDAWGLPACGVAGLLASPISWSHHWVWCIPIALLLWTRTSGMVVWRRGLILSTLLVFPSFVVWSVPHMPGQEWHMTGFELVRSSCYVVFGIGFLLLAARPHGFGARWTARRARPEGEGSAPNPAQDARVGARIG